MECKEDGISDDEVDLFDKWSGTFEEHGLSWEEQRNMNDKNSLSELTEELRDRLKCEDPILVFEVLLAILKDSKQPRSVANMLCGYINANEWD